MINTIDRTMTSKTVMEGVEGWWGEGKIEPEIWVLCAVYDKQRI